MNKEKEKQNHILMLECFELSLLDASVTFILNSK